MGRKRFCEFPFSVLNHYISSHDLSDSLDEACFQPACQLSLFCKSKNNNNCLVYRAIHCMYLISHKKNDKSNSNRVITSGAIILFQHFQVRITGGFLVTLLECSIRFKM